MSFDLDGYLDRIGLGYRPRVDFEDLVAVTRAQTMAMAFENIDPYSGNDVHTDEDALVDKLLRRGRGGYCFELNGLLGLALDALGFLIEIRLARVHQGEAGFGARTHQVAIVETEAGPCLADCGFGGATPASAMTVDPGCLVSATGEVWQVETTTAGMTLFSQVGSERRPLYRLPAGESFVADDVMVANHYCATHPQSRFREHLVLSRRSENGRVAMLDRRLRRVVNGEAEEREIESVTDLEGVLAEDFGLPPADLPLDVVARRLGL